MTSFYDTVVLDTWYTERIVGEVKVLAAVLTATEPWSITWSDGDLQGGIITSPDTRVVEPASDTTYLIAAVSDAYCRGTAAGSATVVVDGSCGDAFYTVAPCRIVDTRGPAGPYGGPALQGRQTRAFALGGECGVPTSAKAVALNVTVVGATARGYLTIYPDGESLPGVSTINFASGQTRANNGVSALGVDGAIAVYFAQASTATVQLVVDVTGYFE